MVIEEADSKHPVEVGLQFPPTVRSGDIRPCSGVEALPDLGVALHLI